VVRERVKCSQVKAPFTFYEFFAGGDIARISLGFTCQSIFANV
jgi:hypothetical protein